MEMPTCRASALRRLANDTPKADSSANSPSRSDDTITQDEASLSSIPSKAEKYRDHEFDRQYAEYEARLHVEPPIWRRAWFYAAIAAGVVFVLYIVFTLTNQPLPP